MKKAEDILHRKFQEGSLAPLYILYHDSHFSELDWINNFVEQSTKLKDHPDILILEKENSENQYKVNSSATLKLYQAINTNPIKLSKKLIFITSAQDLSDIVANKLLKIFEELDSKYCIFLLCPENAPMLATVLSRAVKLTIKSNDEKEETNNVNFEGISTPFDLAKLLKQTGGNSKNIEKIFVENKLNEILAASIKTKESYEIIESTLKHLKQLDKHSNFNNSKITTLTPFIK